MFATQFGYMAMTREHIINLFDEAIELELNMSKLYFYFNKKYKEDADFWWQLAQEEINHASMLKGIIYMFEIIGKYPKNVIPENIEDLKMSNQKVQKTLKKFEFEKPSRIDALNTAFELELFAGEIHCQTFLKSKSQKDIFSHLKDFNKNDTDHAFRISKYLKSIQDN